MKQKLTALVLTIALALTPMTAFAAGGGTANTQWYGQIGHITGSNVCFRTKPEVNSNNVMGFVQYGDKFALYSNYNASWRNVQMISGTWNGYSGYVSSQYSVLDGYGYMSGTEIE